MRVIEEESQITFNLEVLFLTSVPLAFAVFSYLVYRNFVASAVPLKKSE